MIRFLKSIGVDIRADGQRHHAKAGDVMDEGDLDPGCVQSLIDTGAAAIYDPDAPGALEEQTSAPQPIDDELGAVGEPLPPGDGKPGKKSTGKEPKGKKKPVADDLG